MNGFSVNTFVTQLQVASLEAMRLDQMANVAAANGKQAAEAGNGALIDRTHHVTSAEVGWRSGFECRGQVAVSAAEAVAVSVWQNFCFAPVAL